MNKLVYGTLAIIVVALVWVFTSKSGEVTYVADLDAEVAGLEADLAEIEEALASGDMTPEEAVAAQNKIFVRLDSINASAGATQGAQLTKSQKMMLENALNRLKTILTNYQETLAAVDEVVEAIPEAERPRLNARGSRSATRAVAEAVETVESVADVVIEDFVPEEGLSDKIIEDSLQDEGVSDEVATTTEDEGVISDEMPVPGLDIDEMEVVDEAESEEESTSMDTNTNTDEGNITDTPEEETTN